jgi:predicted GNAT superfamily acetyltransferase
MLIRDATRTDFPEILALNAQSVRFLSPLDAPRLEILHQQSSWHRVLARNDRVLAFLLALREGATYDSVNYRWFRERYTTFWYIDRVVVAATHQGEGLGQMLYADFFAHVRRHGPATVTCEFDIDPPNPGSERFHRRFGFSERGRQVVAGGQKTVSLQTTTVVLEPQASSEAA